VQTLPSIVQTLPSIVQTLPRFSQSLPSIAQTLPALQYGAGVQGARGPPEQTLPSPWPSPTWLGRLSPMQRDTVKPMPKPISASASAPLSEAGLPGRLQRLWMRPSKVAQALSVKSAANASHPIGRLLCAKHTPKVALAAAAVVASAGFQMALPALASASGAQILASPPAAAAGAAAVVATVTRRALPKKTLAAAGSTAAVAALKNLKLIARLGRFSKLARPASLMTHELIPPAAQQRLMSFIPWRAMRAGITVVVGIVAGAAW